MRYFTCDTHADTLMRMIDLGYRLDDDRLQVSIPKMQRGGHDLQMFPCFVDPVIGRDRYVPRTLQMIDLLRTEVERQKKLVALCDSIRQIKKAREQNKIIALLAIEGGHAIANDLSVLRCYRQLGVTYMTLTWSNTNDWADSSTDEERWGGLTQFGQTVVREMNRIGMMVDISHVSDKTFWHVLRISTKPAIASHSSVRSICKHPRNMSDEMIKGLAAKGGVIFINFYSSFVKQEFFAEYEKLKKRYARRLNEAAEKWRHKPEMITYEQEAILRAHSGMLPRVKLQDVVRHVEYACKIAGVEAVGIGSDFDGIPFWPEGLEDCTNFPRLLDALRKRGFKSSEVDKIAGKNFLRVFEDAVG